MKHDNTILNTGNWLKTGNNIQYLAMVKPYSQKELCGLYETTNKTFRKWVEPFADLIGSKNGRYYSILQVEIIFLKLGIPYIIKEAE